MSRGRSKDYVRGGQLPDIAIGERLAKINGDFFARFPHLRPTPGGKLTDVRGREWIDGKPPA